MGRLMLWCPVCACRGLQKHLVIALFLTMLTGTAGNAGNQSSAMVIRGLATGEINRQNAWKVIVRELKVGIFVYFHDHEMRQQQ